nr:hypothetical protein CFP56_13171 [Quercus suber]
MNGTAAAYRQMACRVARCEGRDVLSYEMKDWRMRLACSAWLYGIAGRQAEARQERGGSKQASRNEWRSQINDGMK